MEAAVIPKTHSGAGQYHPEIIQVQQQDLIPAVGRLSKARLGGQDRAAQLQDLKKPLGVTCGP